MSLSTSATLSSAAAQQRLEAEFPLTPQVSDERHHFSPSTIQPSSVFKFPGVTYETIFIDNIGDMAPIDRTAAPSKKLGEDTHPVIIDMTNWDNIQLLGNKKFAQAAVHSPDIVAALFPPNWPNVTGVSSGISDAATQPVATISNAVKNAFSALSISGPSLSTTFTPSRDLDRPRELHHPGLLELYAELCDADKLDPGPYDPDMMIDRRMRNAVEGGRAAEIQRIAEKWALSEAELVVEGDEMAGPPGWGTRTEELQILCTLLASATGRPGRETRVDFFLRVILLKSYLLVVFHTALSRGRPRITPEVLLQHSAHPSPPSRAGSEESGSSEKSREVIGDPRDGRYGNPWMEVVESSMYSKDSHVMKSIRSLILYSTKHGHKQPGHLLGTQRFGSEEESIPGISKLGGDIFIRAAGMIMEVMGWAKERREGEKEGWWDTSALGWDDAWKQ
ncbi:hypothetical protein QFC19_004239 [Naganishia cerealis]|uniref:Uncharacterized protein n=1 Tax=Naganishia cerealis TaxID=610337 RepID=A0ACC2VXF4_9TREE|nr:hypothetical protein QFC19_004239 [Naganishia cerealis]